MRLGVVKGRVVLNFADRNLVGTRFLVVEPITAESLDPGKEPGGGKQLIVADRLNPGEGEIVGFVEGREGANPYWPGRAPVDAYCSLIVDRVSFRKLE